MLGKRLWEAMCFDDTKRLYHIKGKLRKMVWKNISDIIILVGLPDNQDNKGNLILKHNADEAVYLQVYGKVPKHAKINETNTFGASTMVKSSLIILDMMIKTMIISKLNSMFSISSFLRTDPKGYMAPLSFRKFTRLLCSLAILSWHPFPKWIQEFLVLKYS